MPGVDLEQQKVRLHHRDADDAVGGAQFARVVDDLGYNLREAERDQREVNAARADRDPTGNEACRGGHDQRYDQRAPERRREVFQHQGRGVRAQAKEQRLSER